MRHVFYNQQINKVTPHFNFMRWAQNADTHTLKQHRPSQNITPVCSTIILVIASDLHLESESEKRAENVDFHTVKNMCTTNTFSLFVDDFLPTVLRPIYCSLTCTFCCPGTEASHTKLGCIIPDRPPSRNFPRPTVLPLRTSPGER